VSDVVAQGTIPDDLRRNMEAWVGCVSGALEENEYRDLLAEAGVGNIDIQVTRTYDPRELSSSVGSGSCCGPSTDAGAPVWDEDAYGRYAAAGGQVVSAFIRATKPVA
jgi:arsenite methyltransferase